MSDTLLSIDKKDTMTYYIKHTAGATAIEYALIAAGVSLAILLAVFAFGGDLSALYDQLTGAVTEE